MVRPESWTDLAGESPIPASTGAPGSGPRFVGENRRARWGAESLLKSTGTERQVIATSFGKAARARRIAKRTDPLSVPPARDAGHGGSRAASTGEERAGAPGAGLARIGVPRFARGRGCPDATEATCRLVKGKSLKREWIFGADLMAAFDLATTDNQWIRLYGDLQHG